MHVLVTGAAGLVGSAVCKWLLSNGVAVTGIFNRTPISFDHPHFLKVALDLTKEKINTDTRFDCVIHCSALLPNATILDEHLYDRNQEIDQSVFSYCLNKSVKLVYISTAYLYLNSSGNVLSENSELADNLTGYYKSKLDSERYLTQSKLEHIIFRISSPYGELTKQSNVMRIFADKIKAGHPVTLTGDGSREQNFIHIDDISQACLLALNKGSGIYNLTYDKSYSMLELASLIKQIYHSRSEFLFNSDKPEVKVNVNFGNLKIKHDLNWLPAFDLRTGLNKTLMN